QIVAYRVKKEVIEEILSLLGGRRVTRAKALVDLKDRLFGRRDLVGLQGVAQVGSGVYIVDKEHINALDLARLQFLDRRLGQLLVDLHKHLTGRSVVDILGRHLAHQLLKGDRDPSDLSLGELANGAAREFF